MLRRGVKVQLVAFVVIALVAVGYGLIRFAGVGELVNPPYQVRLELRDDGGLYPKAQVSLLGVRVGEVAALHPKRSGGVVADLRIDHGERIPADITATVASTTAVGEQYVQLTPKRAGGAMLEEGSVIPASRTSVPLPVENLLANLNALAASVPKKDLATTLDELGQAFHGAGHDLRRLLTRSNDLTRAGLDNLDDLIALIDSSRTVLDTQVDLGPHTTRLAGQLAELTGALRDLTPDTARLLARGVRSGEQVTGLLRDNRTALPDLLTHMLTTTDVTLPRLPGMRKTLVVFPYVLEGAMSQIRYCDEYHPRTAEPIERTCHYDPRTGEPIWTEHFALEVGDRGPGAPPSAVCTQGYENTHRYLPSGQPADGDGPRQRPDSPPNLDARCTVEPDSATPNVRGSQNAVRGPAPREYRPTVSRRVAVSRDGTTRPVLDHIGQPPPAGADRLGWLLTHLLDKEVD